MTLPFRDLSETETAQAFSARNRSSACGLNDDLVQVSTLIHFGQDVPRAGRLTAHFMKDPVGMIDPPGLDFCK